MLVAVMAAQVDFHLASLCPFMLSLFEENSEDCAKGGFPALFSENEFPAGKASRNMATSFAPAQSSFAPALR
jgi:hypothetical protein